MTTFLVLGRIKLMIIRRLRKEETEKQKTKNMCSTYIQALVGK